MGLLVLKNPQGIITQLCSYAELLSFFRLIVLVFTAHKLQSGSKHLHHHPHLQFAQRSKWSWSCTY